jgi:hypothetical protein
MGYCDEGRTGTRWRCLLTRFGRFSYSFERFLEDQRYETDGKDGKTYWLWLSARRHGSGEIYRGYEAFYPTAEAGTASQCVSDREYQEYQWHPAIRVNDNYLLVSTTPRIIVLSSCAVCVLLCLTTDQLLGKIICISLPPRQTAAMAMLCYAQPPALNLTSSR